MNYENSISLRWKVAIAVVSAVAGLLLIGLYSFRDESPEGYRKAVEVFEGRKRVDRLCDSLPVPEGSRLTSRSVEGSTQRFAVNFDFESQLKIDFLTGYYEGWLLANNWRRDTESSFKFIKNYQSISIGFGGAGRYSLYCSEVVGSGIIPNSANENTEHR